MNKEEPVRFSAVFSQAVHDALKEDAARHKRSMAKQLQLVLEEHYELSGGSQVNADQVEVMAELLELSQKPGFAELLRALQSQGEPNRLPSFRESYENHQKQGKK